MSEIMRRLDSLRELIQSKEFLDGKGLSNEVNIRIFCYDAKDEMTVRHFTDRLVTNQSLDCHLIEYNLVCQFRNGAAAIRTDQRNGRAHGFKYVVNFIDDFLLAANHNGQGAGDSPRFTTADRRI